MCHIDNGASFSSDIATPGTNSAVASLTPTLHSSQRHPSFSFLGLEVGPCYQVPVSLDIGLSCFKIGAPVMQKTVTIDCQLLQYNNEDEAKYLTNDAYRGLGSGAAQNLNI